jgi:hypothetical protein
MREADGQVFRSPIKKGPIQTPTIRLHRVVGDDLIAYPLPLSLPLAQSLAARRET